MSKNVEITDDEGIKYEVDDIEAFYNHLLKFHATGVSLHEEKGHFFTVDKKFRKKIKQLADF